MISEESYDTEVWIFSITEISHILKYIKIENIYFKLIIFYNVTDFTDFFYQIIEP